MLIFQNFISRYENFKSRDSSITRNLTRQSDTVSGGVRCRAHLPSPHPLGINYCRVAAIGATPLGLVGPCRADRSMSRDEFRLFVVTRMLCSGDLIFKICIRRYSRPQVNLRNRSVDHPVHVHKQRINCRGLVGRGFDSSSPTSRYL